MTTQISSEEVRELLLQSSSIDAEEKQMWLDIFPTMEKIHFERLKKILLDEKEKLEALEKKYKKEA
jgi:hypothetical protein